MRPRNLLILFLVVAALAAFLWFVERDLPGTEEREELAQRVLPGLEAGEVTVVTLESGGERVRLERVEPAAGAEVESGAGADGGEDAEPGQDAEPEESSGAREREREWRLTAPERLAGARADRGAVEDLLASLAGLDHERAMDDVDPAGVGLDEPRARVALETAGGARRELLVGGEVPASRNMVVAVRESSAGAGTGDEADGEGGAEPAGALAAHVVDRALLADLTRAPGDWRARDLFPATRAEIEGVTLDRGPAVRGESGAERVVLVRRDDGDAIALAFDLAAPVDDRADREAVSSLLSTLTGLRVEEFLDALSGPASRAAGAAGASAEGAEATGTGGSEGPGTGGGETDTGGAPAGTLEDAGLAPPRGAVVVELEGRAEPFRVEVGAPAGDGSLHLRVDDRVVTARAPLLEALQRPAAEWSSPALTDLRQFGISQVTVADGGAPLHLVRDGTEWRRSSGEGEVGDGAGEAIPYTPVSDLLYALTEARAERVLPREAVRLRAPELVVTLTAEPAQADAEGSAGEEQAISFHPAGPGGTVPATVSGRDRVLELSAETAVSIRDALEAVRAAEPLPADEGDGGELPEGVEVEVEEGP